MKNINIYCGKVNSQGGSKISLLNIIYLLNDSQKPMNIFVGKEGWFTEKLEENEINYTIIREPSIFQKNFKEVGKMKWFLLATLSIPLLLKNWIIISKLIKKEENIIINEPRDLLAFLPFFVTRNRNLIQWIRSEKNGMIGEVISKRADKIVTVTDVVKHNLNQKLERKAGTIHNFMVEKPLCINKKDINTKFVNLAVIGSIQQIKGQLDAVKVLSLLPRDKNLKLHIIGRDYSAEYTKVINDYIRKEDLEESVEFIGHIDNITEYLSKKIHITLIPSQTESFCRVAMESNSVGVPVIAYKVGGLKEVILHEKTGYLVEKDNIAELAEIITLLLSSSTRYKNIKTAAILDWEERFYSENLKDKIFKLFK